ncbi:Clavaminate synthase-like protein [Mycena alexandri]|uniref:Clavaminate synthase-like protein n=1 Tax=Mycena alexandri TaxID=1745969 RepID=A0AAD6T851_9AGAR|nr:Clavaminate synthase-like protein [Mycena alexandri]
MVMFTEPPKKSCRHNKVQATTKLQNGKYNKVQSFKCRKAPSEQLVTCYVGCSGHKKKADTCRFKSVRKILYDGVAVLGYDLKEQEKDSVTVPDLPKSFNVPLVREHINEIELTLAKALLPILQEELRHIDKTNATYLPCQTGVRTTCGVALSALWGQEACAQCFELILKFEGGPTGPKGLECAAHTLRHPHFFDCTTGAEGVRMLHNQRDFRPKTIFRASQLKDAIQCMLELVETPPPHKELPMPETTLISPPDAIPSLGISTCAMDGLSDDIFNALWFTGEPLLVTGTTQNFTSGEWAPLCFIKHYGDQECQVVDCQSGEVENTTVSQFFQNFGKKTHNRCLKLKDWPPQPCPYQISCDCDGVLNISSRFPKELVPPDLGPKMNNAHANPAGTGRRSTGSTKLHMDMAEALNIMMYAGPRRNKQDGPGCAAWDIFRATDSDKLRDFLREKFPEYSGVNPIHSQGIYLTDELRLELYQKTQVMSYHVYQKLGEGVFIPAGCAHQVTNLSDCMKIAIDFVSPQNIERCATLTKEF